MTLIMCMTMILSSIDPFVASKPTTASKEPQRSNLTSDLKSGTTITNLVMIILISLYGPFWWTPKPLHPTNSCRKSNLTSELKLETPTNDLLMCACVLLLWYGPFSRQRPLQPPKSLRASEVKSSEVKISDSKSAAFMR